MSDKPLTPLEYLEIEDLTRKAQEMYLQHMDNPVVYLDEEDAERYQSLIDRWNNK